VFEKSTRSDARNAGFNVYVLDDACRGVDINVSVAKAWEDMAKMRQEDRIERYRPTDLHPSAWRRQFFYPGRRFQANSSSAFGINVLRSAPQSDRSLKGIC
jgi:hypothetical protein